MSSTYIDLSSPRTAIWCTTEVRPVPTADCCAPADLLDEVSALVLDFGSHTTRAGYAGEDTPRVVCPSYYGYIDETPSSSGTNGDGNGMDVDQPPAAEGAAAAGATENGDSKGKGKRKYFVGEDGVGIWRAGMEVGNFTSDGIGQSSHSISTRCGYEGGQRTNESQWPTRNLLRSSCTTSSTAD